MSTKSPDTVDIAQAMIRYGGGFIQCLGQALLRADESNVMRIAGTWPAEWDKYRTIARDTLEK